LLFTDDISLSFLNKQILPQQTAFKITGFVCCLVGLLFSMWARIYLGKNWSGAITIKRNHELIKTGPYAISRNPIYSGFLLAFLGCAMTGGMIKGYVSLIFVITGILLKIALEEKFMYETFADEYAVYTRKVKRLVPFIY